MSVSRREILKLSGTAAVAAAAKGWAGEAAGMAALTDGREDWEWVRGLFALSRDKVHMSAMLLASHPAPVREAIEEHRRELDADPVEYLEKNNTALTEAARKSAGEYLGVHASHIALTDSTTMGLGLVYNGLKLRPRQEMLTTTEDYFVTHESLRLASEKWSAHVRRIALFDRVEEATEDQIVSRVVDAITPSTRLVAVTWVHSSTGLKIPVAGIAAALREVNAGRDEEDQVLLGVDGVHGFGVEDTSFAKLGCDFLMAGCHKWLFGPRGTGVIAFSGKGLAAVRATIPSFTDDGVFAAWIKRRAQPPGSNNGRRMTPGGFKAFEHRWALTKAFELHRTIGKSRVAARTHELATALKEVLDEAPGVAVRTPQDTRLSAGIVAFDVEGLSPDAVVSRLRRQRIVASVSPYARPYVRLTPSIRNSEAEIEQVAAAMWEIA